MEDKLLKIAYDNTINGLNDQAIDVTNDLFLFAAPKILKTLKPIASYLPYIKDIWNGKDIIFSKDQDELKRAGISFYKNYLQKNPVDIEDYGKVTFNRHNLGKDNTENYKEYPYIRKMLENSKRTETTNNKNELDRVYDHFISKRNGNKFEFTIENIKNFGNKYKMMKNIK